jgi:hypothetical protein
MTVSAMPMTGNKIDVIDAVEDGFRRVFGNALPVIELAWAPYLAVLATQLVPMSFGSGPGMVILGGLIRSFGFLVFGTVFITRWQRYALLGETSPQHHMFSPAWQDVFFAALKLTLFVVVAWVILVWIALLPPRILTVFFPIVGGFTILVVSVRYSLVFPAAAIERSITFKDSWDTLQGNSWRLFAAAGICYVPFALVRVGLGFIGDGGGGWLVWLVCQVLGLIVLFISFGIVASLVSDTYRRLVGNIGDGAFPA